MAWTTSDNLREFFGARDVAAPPKPLVPEPATRRQATRLLRHAAVLGLVIAHLMLLGELTVASDTAVLNFAAAGSTSGLSLSWLTITGMMLAILLLARDWPAAHSRAILKEAPIWELVVIEGALSWMA